jgi:peptide chain release factor 1
MIESLVQQIESRFGEVQAQMADPEVIGDRRRYAEVGRTFNQLAPAAKLAEQWRRAQSLEEVVANPLPQWPPK